MKHGLSDRRTESIFKRLCRKGEKGRPPEFAQSIEKTADPLLRQDMEYLAEAVKEMPGEAIPEGKSSFLEEGDA